jgi:hypothetical protein
MRDLTEALLIEIERRADALAGAFGEDPDAMSRYDLSDAYCNAEYQAEAVAKDVAELCAHIRAKVAA